MRSPDVLVVGGGVIGCSIARRLARRSVKVTVVERDRPGAHASWAAAGMLSPLAESDRPDPFLTLLLAARTRFPALSAELLEETSIDVGYRTEGTLLLALTDGDEAVIEERWRWQSGAGLAVERLDGRRALELEPALAPGVRLALRFPDDHQVDNREMARALHLSARAAGAGFVTGSAVTRVMRDAAGATGVELETGERIAAGAVVVAAGCWSAGIGGLPRPLPVEPVYGQLVALDGTAAGLAHVVDTPRVYLVPRRGGRTVVGATAEHAGFRTGVTDAATRSLRAAAAEAVPGLADAPLLEVWSGLRPGTPDGHPIIGRDPEVPNLFYAAGHFRNGILLAPITGEAIAAMAIGESPPPETAGFGIERFPDQSPR